MKQHEVFEAIKKIHDENNLGLEKNKWGTDKMNPKSYIETLDKEINTNFF